MKMGKTEAISMNKNICITDVSLERIFLNMTIEVQDDAKYSFVLANLRPLKDDEADEKGFEKKLEKEYIVNQMIQIEPTNVTDNKYYFNMNLSAMNGKSFLENGRWDILAIDSSKKKQFCVCSNELAYRLRDLDKIYNYSRFEYAYNVFFRTRSMDDEHLIMAFYSYFMKANTNWRARSKKLSNNTLRIIIKRNYNNAKKDIVQLIYTIIEKFEKKNGKRILFMSETKPYLSGNLKHINERLIERGLDKEYELSYTFRNAAGQNNSQLSWIKTISKMAKQDIIFIDDYAPIFNYLHLSKRTTLIQVWHAGEGFKSVGYSRFGQKGSPHPARSAHKAYDYAITGSERLVKVYSEAFGLPEEKILPLGMARLDGFLDENTVKEKREEFYKKYPKLKNKKIILFCPTFRGTGQKSAHYDYSQINQKKIYDFCGDEYIWAYKMHPFVTEKPDIPAEYKDRIIDLGDYENINDLYYVTEIMITDYSSAYYEFALMSKPVLFYTYDREIYELTRSVHKPVKETAPGKVCDTFEELMQALEKKDYELEKTLQFREDNYKNFDGKAADRVIDTIILGK